MANPQLIGNVIFTGSMTGSAITNKATFLGQLNPGSLSTVTWSNVDLALDGITFPNSNMLSFYSTAFHWRVQATPDAYGGGEMGLETAGTFMNCLWLQNDATAGFSALTCRGSDGLEKFVFGHGNHDTIPTIFADTNYIQTWSGHLTSPTAPPRFFISSDGDYGPIGSGVRTYQRYSQETDGTPVFWRLIPWNDGTEQRRNLEIKDTSVAGLVSTVSKTFWGTLLNFQSAGSVSDTNPTGFQAEIRSGPDDNTAIVLRSCENIDVGLAMANDYHVKGGTVANGGGHRFYTGIRDSAQNLIVQITDDRTVIYNPLRLAAQSIPSSPSNGDIYFDSSLNRPEFFSSFNGEFNVVVAYQKSNGFVQLGGSAPTISAPTSLELRGNDANWDILLRSPDHGINGNDFSCFAGTQSATGGHRFWTNGSKTALGFQIASDCIYTPFRVRLLPQSAPSSPVEGDIYADSTSHRLTYYDGTASQTLAVLASPTFTGTPAAPTATAGTNTTQLATTAFVTAAVTAAAVPAAANPTGTVGASAVNGTATTFMRSDAAPPVNLTVVPTILSTTTGINAKTVANTALYTVPTGKTCVVTGYVVRATAGVSITNGPSAGVGNTAGTSNIAASQGMTALSGTATVGSTSVFAWPIVGMSTYTSAAAVIYFNLGTGATGTSMTIAVDLIGYLF